MPACAWLFDIDGVLTEPALKRVRHEEILAELVARLRRGEPVGGNTGRALAFVEERLLAPLETRVDDARLLQDLFVAGEKGGVTLTYAADGRRRKEIDPSVVIGPRAVLVEGVTDLVETRFGQTMFVDRTKQTMVTIEMADGCAIDVFRRQQTELLAELEVLLARLGMTGQFRVDATRIAVDIEHPLAGKALGARKFAGWLDDRGITPERVLTFGDSPSDFEMAAELHRLGYAVEFVYVGAPADARRWQTAPFPVRVTGRSHDDGTIEYLSATRERPSAIRER